ncbi:MAG: COX15/CtaA family protein [Myxococcota bacterium]|nr:COX15/CtaA family protein [Myxococcota bacterium]
MRDAPSAALEPADRPRGPGAALAFVVLVALTSGLIVLGALVRAHDAGLACPDWPRCFGVWLPEMDLQVAFEWTHRLVAGCISLLFAGAALFALRRPATRRAAWRPLALGAVLLAVQIVLGGLTVLLQLASWTVTAHLLTGNAFNATLLWTALALREAAAPRARPTAGRGLRLGLWAVAVLGALQMALGGLVSSTYAGMACPEWPTCNGGAWFPTWSGPVGLHLLHRTNGYGFALALLALAWAARRHATLARPLAVAAGLVLLQIGVGILNVRLGIPVEVTGLHSALAAGLVLAFGWTFYEARAAAHTQVDRAPVGESLAASQRSTLGTA